MVIHLPPFLSASIDDITHLNRPIQSLAPVITIVQLWKIRNLLVPDLKPGPVAEMAEGRGTQADAVALGGGVGGAFEDADGEAEAPGFEGGEEAAYARAGNEEGGVVWWRAMGKG